MHTTVSELQSYYKNR